MGSSGAEIFSEEGWAGRLARLWAGVQALRRLGGGERRNQGAGEERSAVFGGFARSGWGERVSSVSGHDWIYLAVPSVSGLLAARRPRAVTLRATAGLPGNALLARLRGQWLSGCSVGGHPLPTGHCPLQGLLPLASDQFQRVPQPAACLQPSAIVTCVSCTRAR